MTENEAAALAWVRQYLAGHHCPRCESEWITGASTSVLVHHCTPTAQRSDWRTPRQRHDDERQAWATELFGALEAAVGDAALLEGDTDE